MPRIIIKTLLPVSPDRAFDLARSIDAHLDSAHDSNEEAVGGRTSGLIEMGEAVTWRARHFGIKFELTVRITQFDRPQMFVDEMERGPFKSMRHAHRFESTRDGTLMTDEFEFESPLGLVGRIADKLILSSYLRKFLSRRATFLAKHCNRASFL